MAAPLFLGLSRVTGAVLLEDEKRTEAELAAERHRLDAAEEEALVSREARERREHREHREPASRPH